MGHHLWGRLGRVPSRQHTGHGEKETLNHSDQLGPVSLLASLQYSLTHTQASQALAHKKAPLQTAGGNKAYFCPGWEHAPQLAAFSQKGNR